MAVKKQSAKAAEKPAAKASDKKADNKTASTKQAKTEEKRHPKSPAIKKQLPKRKKCLFRQRLLLCFLRRLYF